MPNGKVVTASSAIFLLTAGIISAGRGNVQQQDPGQWTIHDPDRPLPPVVTPGGTGPGDPGALPPADAIVLFDGADLSQWIREEGGPARWKVENGYMEVVGRSGSVSSVKGFGDCQLHLEYAMPDPPSGQGQSRGNSGVFLMGLYEIQILDSFENVTYADGMMGAVYGQYPPLVNACRRPGQWQTLDIIFRRPRFGADGKLLSPARFTVIHNGVLIHENVEPTGPTSWRRRPPYEAHPERLPVSLQDHGYPVRFRNIWIRDLEKDKG